MGGGAGIVATAFLTLSLFHQDPATDNRHDWLTRPITPLNLFLAKGLFLALAVVVPHFIAGVIDELLREHTIGEAFLAALAGLRVTLLLLLPVIALGVITSTLVEAMIVAAVPAVLFIAYQVNVTLNGSFAIRHTGVDWISDGVLFVVLVAGALLALRLLYVRKSTMAPRAALAAAVAFLIFNPMSLAPGAALAIQRAVSANPASATPVQITVEAMCGTKRPARTHIVRTPFSDDPSASTITFNTKATGAPAGWRAVLDRGTGEYVSRAGKSLPDQPPTFTGRQARAARLLPGGQTWVASGSSQTRLAQEGARLRLRHDITLLKPIGAADLVVGGPRTYLRDFGYCSATREMGHLKVSCFSPLQRASLITASAGGETNVSTRITYRPGFLPSIGVSQILRVQPGREGTAAYQPPPTRLTAYSAEAHVSRTNLLDVAALTAAPACPGSAGTGS